ncbi:MAG: biliverdin-producing heme oxygenase [Nannocystis sp.]|uniref:biliverdin-producing heme oxygenase n=1 Tax=Nannocystis sp. TaxID=1962667 RepID=UPI002423278C|nr:biliverdin-producing heme oxygenase [Nannocystis sp.]MBK9755599.1 biliverdin-producing heme oxygenase [Nannocystis sp.]
MTPTVHSTPEPIAPRVTHQVTMPPIVGPLARPELLRRPAIARDLATLGAATQPPVAAARAYADRLHTLADHHPALLVAHAYTRYLGDLSGGQLLRRGAARTLGTGPEGPGLEFYDFPEIADPGAYKRELRACLDALPVDAATAAAIVDEARRAFTDTASVFAALAASE